MFVTDMCCFLINITRWPI